MVLYNDTFGGFKKSMSGCVAVREHCICEDQQKRKGILVSVFVFLCLFKFPAVPGSVIFFYI